VWQDIVDESKRHGPKVADIVTKHESELLYSALWCGPTTTRVVGNDNSGSDGDGGVLTTTSTSKVRPQEGLLHSQRVMPGCPAPALLFARKASIAELRLRATHVKEVDTSRSIH
jgi:hypothetical protein